MFRCGIPDGTFWVVMRNTTTQRLKTVMFGHTGHDYTTCNDELSSFRSDEMKEMITSFFLRADKFETEIKKTPYTLMDLLQSLGATWSFLGITVGLVARKINGLVSSRHVSDNFHWIA